MKLYNNLANWEIPNHSIYVEFKVGSPDFYDDYQSGYTRITAPVQSLTTLKDSYGAILGITDVYTSKQPIFHAYPCTKILKSTISHNGSPVLSLNHLDSFIVRNIVVEGFNGVTLFIGKFDITIIVGTDVTEFSDWSSIVGYLFEIGSEAQQVWDKTWSIRIHGKNVSITPKSELSTPINLKQEYNSYIIRGIDYHNAFKDQLEALLKPYGIELLRAPLDEDRDTDTYITYKYTSLDEQETYRAMEGTELLEAPRMKAHVDFEFSSPNLDVFLDFRNKLRNFTFITNWTEFEALDIYTRHWKSNIFWSLPQGEFSQEFSTDQAGFSSHPFQFSCDYRYYVMRAETYAKIQQVIGDLLGRINDYVVIHDSFKYPKIINSKIDKS